MATVTVRATGAHHRHLSAGCQGSRHQSDPVLHLHNNGNAAAMIHRRSALLLPLSLPLVSYCRPAIASKLPEGVDSAWEKFGGGGPADLTFPPHFLGKWSVDSVLTDIKLPFGAQMVPDMQVIKRAESEDLNKLVKYSVAFVQNQRSQVVFDRRFNVASLMETYLGLQPEATARNISWDVNDPNNLQLTLPDIQITTRVTRRSEEELPGDRLETSEFYQQLFEAAARPQPKVKASQTFTKYHWRSKEQASGGPEIIATQIVSDYLTGYDDASKMMATQGKPVTLYTYRISFQRV